MARKKREPEKTGTETEATPEPRSYSLDDYDRLYIQNVLLKENNFKLSTEMAQRKLADEREGLHDFIVEKYKVDLSKETFEIEEGVLRIAPK